MHEKIEAMLEKVQKAPRYTGGEMNTTLKPWDEAALHFAFCFPDTYEVAMSHLGMKILYHGINSQPDMLCERVCMPWVDMMELMQQEDVPLFSLENRRALNEFDVVGFTLQYEMSYTNILAMLKLGGIALKREERGEEAPIIVAGGPCAFNPEPLADFIDAFMVGDGEEQILELNRIIRDGRKEGASRLTILKRLCGVQGVYVPALYDVTYHADGTIASMKPNCPEAPEKVLKAIIKDLDETYYPTEIPVPYTEIIHDRIMLEIMRGCTRGCRFCQAGMLYRPVRERSLERLVDLAVSLENATGYEDISLSSLSSGDYTCLAELIRELIRRLKEKRVSISLPSLRLDSVLKESLEETQKERKTSLTFAPEAGTQRLRDVINKGVTEEDLIEKVRDAFAGGWSSVKLYFMMGLPTETYEDLDGIADLARKVTAEYFAIPKAQRAKGLRVTCSASVFVPKPFTPFQWEPQDTQEIVKEKQKHLRDKLREVKGVNFNYHESDLSYLEACFARGDRRMGKVLLRAFEKGCMLDSWGEHFKYEAWREAFEETGIDPAFYAFRRREKDEIMPWDVIDCGVTKEFLWREKEKADRAATTKDCRKGCNGCGLQRFKGVCKFCG
ncbi:MAG: TIGR03960 family B12-binding radical SAM protein [Clostridia bacterium]|nr:TIGR03960 family B12-binding radical SAM protein [Clostridia bacterium]